MHRKATPRPFKRAGLHRLACFCGNYAYGTVAALERHGLPVCPCGERLEPERLELALELGLDELPVVREFYRRTHRKTMAQSRTRAPTLRGFVGLRVDGGARAGRDQRGATCPSSWRAV
jgi:hypothetical protein